ncbi:hypothetical protein TcWFU_008385 [Taenia crassiceps]|uniref:Uncharacterized protein n=1 Tax=Taenia crassiceps TaxID=6207 RepID=A0ABR4QBN5_9CEST
MDFKMPPQPPSPPPGRGGSEGKPRSGICPAVPPRICSHLSSSIAPPPSTLSQVSPVPYRKSKSAVDPPAGLATEIQPSTQHQTIYHSSIKDGCCNEGRESFSTKGDAWFFKACN